MVKPGIEEVKQYAANEKYGVVPVSMEMMSDIRTPMEVLRTLRNISDHCYMLESVLGNEKWGRYTFLGFDPKFEITCADNTPPSIPINNQGKRAREMRHTLELDSTFSEIPEANWKSLSASSLMMSTTSSMVMRPTNLF